MSIKYQILVRSLMLALTARRAGCGGGSGGRNGKAPPPWAPVNPEL